MIVSLFYDSSNGKEYSLDSFYMNSSSICDYTDNTSIKVLSTSLNAYNNHDNVQ